MAYIAKLLLSYIFNYKENFISIIKKLLYTFQAIFMTMGLITYLVNNIDIYFENILSNNKFLIITNLSIKIYK